MAEAYQIVPLGDGALLIQVGNQVNEAANKQVHRLFHHLKNTFPFIIDLVPAYASLAVYYDVQQLRTSQKTAYEAMKEKLLPLLPQAAATGDVGGKNMHIPVCYAKRFAPDIEMLATQKELSVEAVIALHTALTYRVYMIGFLPGFPYMGKVDSRIATPRKSTPRTAIPAGSVGIAGEQTGIYPLASPGGWNIIGRTPVRLFNKEAAVPVLLQPGDSVAFYSITEDEFENYQNRPA